MCCLLTFLLTTLGLTIVSFGLAVLQARRRLSKEQQLERLHGAEGNADKTQLRRSASASS